MPYGNISKSFTFSKIDKDYMGPELLKSTFITNPDRRKIFAKGPY